jgi:KDO2-lipid IV(A) lauroyltransferase
MTFGVQFLTFRLLGSIIAGMPRFGDVFLFRLVWFFFRIIQKAEVHRVNAHLGLSRISPVPSAESIYQSMFLNGLDSLRYLLRKPQMDSRVQVLNAPLLQQLLKNNIPVVVVSIHIGAFEMLHRSLSRFDRPMNLITSHHLPNALERFLESVRSTSNLKMFRPEDSPRLLKELIRQSHPVAIMIDQSRQGKGIEVPFLGRPNHLWLRFPLQANQAGATIVTVRAIRKEGKHIIQFENAYPPHTDTQTLTQSLTQEFEQWIRENPEQWTWNYPRLWESGKR